EPSLGERFRPPSFATVYEGRKPSGELVRGASPLGLPGIVGEVQARTPHFFGTDALGRDLLSRVLAGSQVSFAVGLVATAVSLVIGITWGSVAGWRGG